MARDTCASAHCQTLAPRCHTSNLPLLHCILRVETTCSHYSLRYSVLLYFTLYMYSTLFTVKMLLCVGRLSCFQFASLSTEQCSAIIASTSHHMGYNISRRPL